MSDTFLVAVEKCPLCENTSKKLTCPECIWNGNFCHTSHRDGATYAQKGRDLVSLSEQVESNFLCVQSLLERNASCEKRKTEIGKFDRRIRTLREVVDSLKEDLANDIARFREKEEQYRLNLAEFEHLKSKESDVLAEIAEVQSSCYDLQLKLQEASVKLVKTRRETVDNLKEDIFPITTRPCFKEFGTPPIETIATRSLSSDIVMETTGTPELDLEDATTCTYKEGQWVQSSLTENEYCIVGCGLPASGDYIKYFEWLKSHRKEGRGPELEYSIHSHPALEIPAALTYLCQMVRVTSKILGVNLPFRTSYGDFANPYANLKKLFESIVKLNKNIMYLSYSQLVDAADLSPLQALQNIDICFSNKTRFLGHTGNFETYEYVVPEEPSDFQLDFIDEFDSDYDDDDSCTKEEWDSLTDLQEVPKNISEDHSISSSATGLVTSAAASVVSLWPWKKT